MGQGNLEKMAELSVWLKTMKTQSFPTETTSKGELFLLLQVRSRLVALT